MKIGIINKHCEDIIGGSEIQCDFIAKGLEALGHEVLYIAVAGNRLNYSSNYKVIPVRREPAAIVQACAEHSPDIVYWRFNKHLFLPVARRIRKMGIPIVFAVAHINDLIRFSCKPQKNKYKVLKFFKEQKQKVQNAYNHFGFRYVDGITVNNKNYLRFIKECKETMYIPNVMVGSSIEFNWTKPFCLWVASIKSSKNPEKFVGLAETLNEKSLDFIMVGEIQQKNYHSYINKKTKDIPNLYYLGKKSLEEVNGILRESLFLVHTCEPEGFPNNMIQAWLQGRPTVSLYFDPGGFIESEKIGLFSKNVKNFTNDVKKLIEDKKLRHNMGSRAYNFASNHFSLKENIKKLENLFYKVIDHKA